MTDPNFARYHLLPHLGLVLFFCGGLPGRAERWFSLSTDGTLSRRQRRMIGVLIGVSLLIQLAARADLRSGDQLASVGGTACPARQSAPH